MEFFEKVKNVASDLAEKGGKKSKELYSVAKIKLKITEKQGNVKNLYKEIGYNAYKAYKAQEDILGAINDKLSQINELETEIATLRNDIECVKNAEDIETNEPEEETIVVDAQRIYDEAEKEPLE